MDALALLRLQVEWGADEALDDAPIDRLRDPRPAGAEANRPPLPLRDRGRDRASAGTDRNAPTAFSPRSFDPAPRSLDPSPPSSDPSPQPAPTSGGKIPVATPSSPPTPAERAAAAAGQAQTLDALRAAIAGFDGCALRDTAANLVFAAGPPDAELLLIGDPPGEAEDRSGTPFAGPDGALLDRMLASIGLNRDSLLLTPLMPWRPPGGRPPNPGELTVCLPFLHRLIALSAAQRLLIAGPLAARAILGATRRRSAPAWAEAAIPGNPRPVPALAMPSPAMVAATPGARREAWAALRLLRRTLDAQVTRM